MSDNELQAKPLAPAFLRLNHEQADDFPVEFMGHSHGHSHRKFIKCCGCSAAIFLITSTIILVLTFTVFHVKDPVLKIESFSINGLDSLLPGGNNSGPGPTLGAAFHVKNSNVAPFKISNTTMTVYYHGSMVGEGTGPPEKARARARGTLHMNASVEVMVDKMMEVGGVSVDVDKGILGFSSLVKISGLVKITSVSKRHIVLNMNCSLSVNVTSKGIQEQNCTKRVSL